MNLYSKDNQLTSVKFLSALQDVVAVKGSDSDKYLIPIEGFTALTPSEWNIELFVFKSYYDRTPPLLVSTLEINSTGTGLDFVIAGQDTAQLPLGSLWCIVKVSNPTAGVDRVIVSCPLEIVN